MVDLVSSSITLILTDLGVKIRTLMLISSILKVFPILCFLISSAIIGSIIYRIVQRYKSKKSEKIKEEVTID